jgi:hypothetical protein
MLILLHILFVIFSILLFLKKSKSKYENIYFTSIILVLIFTAGFRTPNSDRDYQNYLDFFNNAPDIIIEPFFIIISVIIKNTIGNSYTSLFLIFSFLSLGLKYFAIKRLTNLWFISAFVYFSYFFVLHDLTQIRAGVASSFLFFLVPAIYDRKPVKFLFICSIAICFHYSAIIFLFLWFINKGLGKTFLVLLIPVGYFFYFLNFDLFFSLPFESVNSKLNVYKTLQEYDTDREKINVFNLLFLFKILVYYLLLIKFNFLKNINKYSSIIISIYGFSLFSFLFFSKMPIVSFRIYELLGVIEIIAFTFVYYLFSSRLLPLFFYLITAGIYFYVLLYNMKIIL